MLKRNVRMSVGWPVELQTETAPFKDVLDRLKALHRHKAAFILKPSVDPFCSCSPSITNNESTSAQAFEE